MNESIFLKQNNSNLFSRLLWRLKFKKIKISEDPYVVGRCKTCDASHINPKLDCNNYYCPCKLNENLKLKK
jgi:hypothetical protein